MPDPTGRVSHLPHFHRGVAWKTPCRVATTANITIASDLNAGDTIDGVTLAAGDRVLVKDQSTASQNGIYIAGTTPVRAADMDQDLTTDVPAEEIAGAFVWVASGTVNAGTLWHTTNALGGTLGSTSIVWEEFTGGGSSGVTVHDDLTGRDETDNHSTYLLNVEGERHVIAVIPDAGSTETLDLSTANVFDIGLSTGCTLTLTPPTDDGTARVWTLVFSGEFTVTWPGSVVWMDGSGVAPSAAETLAVTLFTMDGGTTYLASAGRGSGASLSDDDPLANGTADPGVSTDASRSDHVHPKGNVVGAILIQDTPAGSPLVFTDLLQNSAGDDLLYADV